MAVLQFTVLLRTTPNDSLTYNFWIYQQALTLPQQYELTQFIVNNKLKRII